MQTYGRDSSGVDLDRSTDSSEGRVLLLIVLDVRQRRTPVLHENVEMRRDERRANDRETSNRHRRVLRQTPRRLRAEEDRDETLHQRVGVLLHVGLRLKGDLSRRPRRVVAYRHLCQSRLDLDVRNEDGHELGEERLENRETRDGRVAEEGVGGLANGSVGVLQAHGEEGENGRVGGGVKVGDGDVQTLGEAGEKVEGNDEERLVGLVVVYRILLILLKLDEGLLDDLYAAGEDGVGVVGETLSDGDDDGGHALRREERSACFVEGREE